MTLINYRNQFLFFLSIVNSFFCFSQSDSIQVLEYNERNLINPPIILENSFHTKRSDSLGYHLFEIDFTPCHLYQIDIPMSDRISNYEIINDSIHEIKVNFRELCYVSFSTEIEIENDSTINLRYQTYGGEIMCSCCYSLKYSIKAFNKQKFKYFKFNGQSIIESEPRYYPIKETIKYFENTKTKEIEYFDYGNNGIKVFYDKNGKITKKEYFDKNGNLIRTTTF